MATKLLESRFEQLSVNDENEPINGASNGAGTYKTKVGEQAKLIF